MTFRIVFCGALAMVAWAASASELGVIHRPAALCEGPRDSIYIYGAAEEVESYTWCWRIDAKGRALWRRVAPLEEGGRPFGLVVERTTSVLGAWSLQDGMVGEGPRAFVQGWDVKGNASAQEALPGRGTPLTLARMKPGAFLLGGYRTRRVERIPGTSARDRDAWVAGLDDARAVAWEWQHDFGGDEAVRSLLPVANGAAIYALVQSGAIDSPVGTLARLQLVKLAGTGELVHTVERTDGYLRNPNDGLLAAAGSGVAMVVSRSAVPGKGAEAIPFYPTRLVGYDETLSELWTLDLTDNTSASTPRVASLSGNRLAVATAGTGIRLHLVAADGTPGAVLTAPGRLAKAPKVDIDGILALQETVYVLGRVTDLNDWEGEAQVVLAKFDVAQLRGLWQKRLSVHTKWKVPGLCW